jgi:D-arabinose 1-dehydrogenase-like Zn-dependent alcohol dehydrogenase
MRSYAFTDWAQPLQLMEQPTPEPRGQEVLVRVEAAGVCHSDLHIHDGFYDLGGGKTLSMTERGLPLPLTMGHETAGTVEAIGPDVDGVRVGQRVSVYPWLGCGECDACAMGEEQNCPNQRTLGIYQAGGYSTHLLVPDAKYCLDIGDLSPDVAALYGCSGITTYRAIRTIDSPVLRDEPILVIGAGGLGLMALTVLKGFDAYGAIVADIDPAKREAALAAGAIAAIDPLAPDAVDQVRAASPSGRGLRAAIDLVGNPNTARFAIDTFVKGAQLVLVGLMGGEFTYPMPYFPMRALWVQGSYVGSLQDMRDLLALVLEKNLPPPPIMHRPLDEAQEAIEDLRNGRVTGRVVLIP